MGVLGPSLAAVQSVLGTSRGSSVVVLTADPPQPHGRRSVFSKEARLGKLSFLWMSKWTQDLSQKSESS